MAFKTLQTKREPLTLEALAQSIARRREGESKIQVPRNDGKRRTSSKQALLDAIARTGADWIIDMDPEGGVRGGQVIAEGTPEDIVKEKKSFTGHYLKPLLSSWAK